MDDDRMDMSGVCPIHKVAYEREWINGVGKSVEFCPECRREQRMNMSELFKEVPHD